MIKGWIRSMLLATALGSLAACGGGGGGGGVAFTPAPPVAPPTPQASAAVNIFQSPASQEFAVLGSGDELRIRYNAGSGLYEVMPGAQGWKTLVDDPLSAPAQGQPNQNFVFADAATNQSFFLIRAHYSFSEPTAKYQYSNLAAWAYSAGGSTLGGITAFGMATPSAAIPVMGTATYNGMIEGVSSETAYDYLAGAIFNGWIGGSINLAFDFGGGTLTGSISPFVELQDRRALGTLAFSNTVYSAGSTIFSGKFDTAISGSNAFSGLFTGPNANELIGNFAFPYTSPYDGKAAQATGAFIGKQ